MFISLEALQTQFKGFYRVFFILFKEFSRQEYWVVCHSLLQWTTFCQTSPPWPVLLGWPPMAWLNFIELDKAVVLWSDWLVFCDCGFSLSALWWTLATPTVLLGFLLPWTWGYLFMAAPAKHSHCALRLLYHYLAICLEQMLIGLSL